MDRKNRWLTHLYLMLLEDRSQPGTLLTTGIDAGALATVIDKQPQRSERVIKRLQATEDMQVVSPALAQTEKLLSAPTASGGTTSAASQIQQVSQNAVNPSVHMPTTNTTERFTVGGRNLTRTKPIREAGPTPTITRVDLGSYSVQGENSRTVNSEVVGDSTDNVGGTRSTVWAHYDTSTFAGGNISGATDRRDTVNDVAVGAAPGPCLDHTITAGVQGRVGTIRYYAPGSPGTLVRQLNVSLVSGTRTEINAIAEHPTTGEIYAVGTRRTSSNVLIENFVAMWAAPGPGCVNAGGPFSLPPLVYPAPFGGGAGVLSLNDIQIELGVASGLEVSYVGTAKNGNALTPWDMVLVSQTTVLLPPPASDPLFDFVPGSGFGAQGLSLAVDDGSGPSMLPCGSVGVLGTRYIGARLDSGGPKALAFSLEDGASVQAGCDWSTIWSGSPPNATTPNLNTGFFGMTQDSHSLYSSGGIQDLGLNKSIVVYTDTYTGGVVFWAWIYGAVRTTGAATGNYTSRGNAAVPGLGDFGDPTDPLGISYTAGSIDLWGQGSTGTITAGDLTQYDQKGNITDFRSSACTNVVDEDTDGKAVALHAGGDVSVGGSTNAYRDLWTNPGLGGCPDFTPGQNLTIVDDIFGGSGLQEPAVPPIGSDDGGPPSDGYVFRDNSPIGG